MILLSLIIYLPFSIIFLIGVLIVIGHNLLDYSIIKTALQGGFLSDLIYFANFSAYELGTNHILMIVYAFLPWTGVMILGYCLGKIFENHVDAEKKKKIFMERRSVFIITLHNSSHFKRIRRSHALGVTSPGWIFYIPFLHQCK